ncbi:MAG: NADH-quinone oxidoreductase subunit N, partial [Nocardioides sp.]
MIEFSKPGIGYAEVWPLLLIFGVACAGVLVEAFTPRARRYVVQVVLSLAGLGVAFVGTVMIGLNLTERAGGAAQGSSIAEGAIAVDGPAVFMWGLILLLAVGGVLLFAERRLEAGV